MSQDLGYGRDAPAVSKRTGSGLGKYTKNNKAA